MIEVTDLSYGYDKDNVLENVSFVVDDNKVMGLVGINGAGKSTLLRMMTGVLIPKTGQISYDGLPPSDPSFRIDIFFLPDDPFYTKNTTPESLAKLYSAFYYLDMEVYNSVLDELKIPKKKQLRSFSKGMRRQTFIALTFAIAPRFLLLDESFDGLDPMARATFKKRLRKLTTEKKSTVIISSHSLKELDDFCDNLIMIDGKSVIASESALAQNVQVHRYQICYKDVVTTDSFEELGLTIESLRIKSRFVTIVCSGDGEEIEKALYSTNPLLLEEIEASFEDVFVSNVDSVISGDKTK